MSVELKNWRMRSPLYHAQIYPTLLHTVGGTTANPEIDYPGYMSGVGLLGLFSPSDFSRTEGIYDSSPHIDPTSISGDLTGASSNSWHSNIYVVASDGKNYSLGLMIVCLQTQIGVGTRYMVYQCVNTDGVTWFNTYCQLEVRRTVVEDTKTVYNRLPEYLYIAMKTSENDYPTEGGSYFTDAESGNSYYTFSYYFLSKLIPALRSAGDDTEFNPDPQPTPIKNDDPYAPGGSSWTGGGSGKFDPTTDDVGIPGLPALSATSTGFITLFNPSVAQLRNLANYMWSGLFDIDTFRKIFADPMDCILGLSIVPVNVPSGGSANVKVGNIDTGISMTTASAQYIEVDCGSVSVEENYGAYLDYEPYTKAELYLPYIGIHAISIDDIMDKTVTIKYHIDILSGACVAYVKCGASVLYSFIGQCASSIPITGNDWTNVINGVLSIAGSIGSMVATGGATAPMSVVGIASTAVNAMKPNIEKSGSMSGTGGMLGIQSPYLILTRPRQAVPAGQNRFIGYPAFITEILGNVSGYTEVESIHLEGIQATGAELSEIETILKTGVIF